MSMIGHLRAVTPAQLIGLRKNASSVKELLHGELIANSGNVKTALLRVQEMTMQAIAAGKSKNDEKLREQIIAELESAVPPNPAGEEGLTLEKSWHCLHYLLTGTAWETDSVLGKVILGGTEIGPDIGYGPARYREPDEVRKVARSLKTVSEKDLVSRFNLKAMQAAKIYSCRDEGDLQLAQDYFSQVRNYYDEAAERGDAMLLYLD
jgi:hypothetical protein